MTVEPVLSRPLLAIDMLRRCFLSGPDATVLGLALAAADADGGSAALASAADALRDAIDSKIGEDEQWISDVAVEWTRLVVGPAATPAVPYASYYLSSTQLVMTEQTLAVRRQYLDAGLALRSGVRLPDDHLGIELDFLFFLERTIAVAESRGNLSEAAAVRSRRADFVDGHLAQWVPRFAADLSGATKDAVIHAIVATLLALISDIHSASQSAIA
jgi:TorA maturation chaperone TorD